MIPLRALAIGCLASLAATSPALADDVLEGHARRGAVYQRLVLENLTPDACSALCDADIQCRSWVWTRAELTGSQPGCALLSAAPTPYHAPGQVTGLSRALADHIEAAAERPASAREIPGLRASADRPH
ncbi:PAN domain-containing protein [Maricaulis sp.]|uniref:PAN domain-containing protein n=1 Tax=Maricaulis sp. TaxID=1486257 RepID=UPI002B277C44|nr:PAN domain-containing protein [Maricaulis sp.]